jgi:hypothetical protein
MILVSELTKEISKLKPSLPGCLEDGDDCKYEEGYYSGYRQAKLDIKRLLKRFRNGKQDKP